MGQSKQAYPLNSVTDTRVLHFMGHCFVFPVFSASTGNEALFQCTKPSGVPRGPSHLQFPSLEEAVPTSGPRGYFRGSRGSKSGPRLCSLGSQRLPPLPLPTPTPRRRPPKPLAPKLFKQRAGVCGFDAFSSSGSLDTPPSRARNGNRRDPPPSPTLDPAKMLLGEDGPGRHRDGLWMPPGRGPHAG